jgi:hypothetical protein
MVRVKLTHVPNLSVLLTVRVSFFLKVDDSLVRRALEVVTPKDTYRSMFLFLLNCV